MVIADELRNHRGLCARAPKYRRKQSCKCVSGDQARFCCVFPERHLHRPIAEVMAESPRRRAPQRVRECVRDATTSAFVGWSIRFGLTGDPVGLGTEQAIHEADLVCDKQSKCHADGSRDPAKAPSCAKKSP